MSDTFELIEEARRLKTELLTTDLGLALTFTKLALEDESPTSRNRARRTNEAEKAYFTVMRLASKWTLTPDEFADIAEKLGSLKVELAKLNVYV
jgi:hypothetical protein